jgi:predicted phage terminase large subunit-like protein
MDEIAKLIYDNPQIIGVDIGFKDLKPIHGEWIREMVWGEGDYTLMAHRAAYKSSCLSVAISLMMVLYPTQNIIFLRKADNDVSEMIRMVTKILKSPIMNDLCVVLHGVNLSMTEEAQDHISTNLWTSPMGASQLLGIGLKSSITGKHSEIVITDDICNVTDRISKAERDRTKLQYQELQNIRNRGGRIINLGTKWHKDDVFTLMDNIHIYDYHRTGLISDEQLQKIKDSMTASLFACNYELRIVAEEDVIFDSPQTGADPALVEQGECHIDAAYGGEDYTAFTICRKKDGKYYVYGRCWRKHIDDVQDDIIKLRQSFNAGRIHCENNGDKGYLGKALRQNGERVNIYHESMNKYLKITSYLKAEWRNVVFVQGTDKEYINQICDYNENAEHDDCPDSLASLIRKLWNRKDASESTYTPIFM